MTTPEPPPQEGPATDDDALARIAPRGRGLRGAALLLGVPFLLIVVIIGGRLLMPVKELKLAPLVPFDAGHADEPPPAMRDAPMVALQGATFTMGSAEKNESPAHPVAVASFSIDPREVSVADFRACVAAGRCAVDALASLPGCAWGTPGAEQHPMNCVDWNEADIYCRWLGRRLPTEAEWEFAARGAAGRAYPWGNQPPSAERACFERGDTCPTGSRPSGATPEGVHDLAGNVWEWTASPYCPYSRPDCDSVERAVRGGSYTAREGAKLKATVRSGHVATLRERYLGFRCAR